MSTRTQIFDTLLEINSNYIDNNYNSNNLAELTELVKNYNNNNLYLAGIAITDEQAIAIIKGLKTNTTLTILSLSGNLITNEGAIKIFKILETNTILTTFYLYDNQIEYTGAIAIAEMLKINKTLIALIITDNNLTYSGVDILLESLKINTTLEHFGLYNDMIYGLNKYINDNIEKQLIINRYNKKVKNTSLQQQCYNIIKNNNMSCPKSYREIYDK